MNIEGLFKTVEKQMQAELEAVRHALTHPGLKGTVNEEAVKNFLRKHLPDNLAIETGMIIDSTGQISKQVDIIIYDKAKTPSLFFAANIRVVPIEGVYAVIEVKTKLDAKALEDCIKNMESVKALKCLAYYPAGIIVHPKLMYGQEHEDWQTIYSVFAYESAEPYSLLEKLNSYASTSQLEKRIDCIFTLDKGVYCNNLNGSLDALPSQNSEIVFSFQNSLLLYYTLMSRYFNQAHIRNFNLNPYIKNLSFQLMNQSAFAQSGKAIQDARNNSNVQE